MTRSNTAKNSATGKPFTKGDARINRKGRPKNFDALRRLALDVAHREVKDDQGEPLVIDGQTITKIEAILMQWSQSSEPTLQKAFVEIAYGKVPNPVEISGPDGEPLHIIMDR